MSLNTIDNVLLFTGLTLDIITISPERLQFYLDLAFERVIAVSPQDTDDDRSNRLEPLRRTCELYFGAAHIWEAIANAIAIAAPDNRIFQALSYAVGADSPTFTDTQSAFFRASSRMFEQGERLLKRIRPITASIEASEPLE